MQVFCLPALFAVFRVVFFFQAEDGIRDRNVTGVQTCALPIWISLEAVEGGLDAPPCREILLTPQVRERARAMAEELPGVRDLLLRIADGTAAEGMESLSPVLVEEMEQVADVLPAGSRFLILDPEKVRARAEELVATTDEFLAAAWSSAAAGGGLPIDVGAASFVPLS